MKLLIVAGGGGHFAAALAVIQELPKEWDVLIVGRKYTFEGDATESFESQTAKKLGIKFATITTGRLQRTFTQHSLQSLLKVPVGYFQALKMVREYKPDVVLSFGGYVSVPVCVAAWSMKIPVLVHEQILEAGLSNKIVSKFAKKVFVSWEQSKKFFPADKVVLTGNPIKKDFVIANEVKQSHKSGIAALLSVARNDGNEKIPLLYITGGSGGSHAINMLIEGGLEQLLEKYVVIHQTGDAKEFGDFDRLEKKKKSLSPQRQKRYLITKFVDPQEVVGILQKADLVVSRSGINTVTELLYFGKPALFIPLPHGQHNEQLTNALFVKQLGMCEVAQQNELTAVSLVALIDKMISLIDSYKKNSLAAKKVIQEDAAQRIISVLTQW